MERVIDMNVEMAYLTGMILGNGEIQRVSKKQQSPSIFPTRICTQMT